LRPLRAISTFFWRRRRLLLLSLLVPPLLWFGVVYLGSLLSLLVESFYTVDEFSGETLREPTLDTYRMLVENQANVDVVLRTLAMSTAVSVACALLGFPLAYYMARYTRGRARAFFYLAVMLPMWASYLVKVYAWRLILAKEGIVFWFADRLGLTGVLEGVLALPVIGGPSLSASWIGTWLVFTYMWLPYMILPIEAALERIPPSLLEASADLGARPAQTFARVTLPLAFPGVVAGSIFTFSLTLGDYIIPSLVGSPGFFIGMMVYQQQGTANNVPLAAAFSVVPIVIMAIYLTVAKRLGAFDAL
jgi:putative spermidine/putrescine transport system permease protein